MNGAGVPSGLVSLFTIAAGAATLALPVIAFVAMRALTRIANELESISKTLSKN